MFQRDRTISTLNDKSLNLVDQFTYRSSNISFTESDVNTRIGKAWTAIDRLSIIWKSNVSDRIKRSCSRPSIIVWLHKLDSNETSREKVGWELLKNAACCFE